MEFARKNEIIGQGRGSAGDSIVAYCLGITKVDPIEHKLLFERFINEARALPDIDIDFDVNRREEVIQYLYTKYGADHAAMVCTIITYRARSAVREVAKALGFPLEAVDAWPRRSTRATPPTSPATWRWTAASRWLFEEPGLDMADAAVPPGRDGRGTGIVHRQVRFVVERSARPAMALQLAARQPGSGRPRGAAGARRAPVSESGWLPPKRARVLDHRSGTVRTRLGARSATRAPASSPARSCAAEPRDNGTPGPSSERPRVVRVDPESGMPIEERRRPRVVPDASRRRILLRYSPERALSTGIRASEPVWALKTR